MATTQLLKNRRKDPFLKSGNRINFERRETYRLLIDGVIKTETEEATLKLLDIDYKGCAIQSENQLFNENILLNLTPLFRYVS